MSEIEWSDRYGGPQNWPDLATICRGQCEGMGVVPVGQGNTEEPWRSLWLEAEAKNGPSDDGYHFVKCSECNGTGKRQSAV